MNEEVKEVKLKNKIKKIINKLLKMQIIIFLMTCFIFLY